MNLLKEEEDAGDLVLMNIDSKRVPGRGCGVTVDITTQSQHRLLRQTTVALAVFRGGCLACLFFLVWRVLQGLRNMM